MGKAGIIWATLSFGMGMACTSHAAAPSAVSPWGDQTAACKVAESILRQKISRLPVGVWPVSSRAKDKPDLARLAAAPGESIGPAKPRDHGPPPPALWRAYLDSAGILYGDAE